MIITLCGSARFEDRFIKWNEKLTMQGHVVFSLAVLPRDKDGKHWYTEQEKEHLDMVHKKKIDASDAIFVINGEERYIGSSTKGEIQHAFSQGKNIYWEFWPNDNDLRLWYPNLRGAMEGLFKPVCPYSYCRNFIDYKAPCPVCYE